MFSFTQKLRMGLTFFGLYRKHALVRWYSKLLLPLAPSNYRALVRLF